MPPPALLAGVGLILVVTTLVVRWQDARVPDGWVTTTARVTRVLPPSDGCIRYCHDTYVIEYRTPGGATDSHLYDGPAEMGESLPFAYDPSGSWKIQNHGRSIPWTMGLPGVVLLVTAGALALFTVPRRRFPLGPKPV